MNDFQAEIDRICDALLRALANRDRELREIDSTDQLVLIASPDVHRALAGSFRPTTLGGRLRVESARVGWRVFVHDCPVVVDPHRPEGFWAVAWMKEPQK